MNNRCADQTVQMGSLICASVVWIWFKADFLIMCLSYISGHYVPHRRGKGHIVFGAEPVGVGVSVGVSIGETLSCLHDIS